jgi:hypothetical protein
MTGEGANAFVVSRGEINLHGPSHTHAEGIKINLNEPKKTWSRDPYEYEHIY